MKTDYNIAWEVAEDCNHNCFYCYNFWRNDNATPCNNKNQEIDFKKIVDKLISLHPVSVSITGGEPLVVFKYIKEHIARLTENSIFIRLLTNGSLITDEIASFLAQHHIQVMVSFPTSNSEQFLTITKKNSYESVLRGLDILKKYNVDVLINIVVCTINLNSMEKTADFLIDRYGYQTIYFSRATKPQNASATLQEKILNNTELQDFFNICLKIKKRRKINIKTCGGYAFCSIKNKKAFPIFAKGCGGGRGSFVISNDGNLRVCGKDMQIFGNIFESDVDTIMKKAGFWIDEASIPKECIQCQYRHLCRGGCHMSSAEKSPQYNSLDFNADPIEGPIKNQLQSTHTFINPLRKYVLNDTANYLKTENGNRFSNAFSFVYLTDKLTNILIKGEKISFFTLFQNSNCSFKQSKRLFVELINKEIITEIT